MIWEDDLVYVNGVLDAVPMSLGRLMEKVEDRGA